MTDDWRAVNRANWDERVGLHLGTEMYDTARHFTGEAGLEPISAAEIGDVSGLRVLHLQCHFGLDSLVLAQNGAELVVGVDFSEPAIREATRLAQALGRDNARFVQSDLYKAPEVLDAPASFDRVFITWGTISWLPDIKGWARTIAHFLKPGGALYFAESHPSALVFDDDVPGTEVMPGPMFSYFHKEPLVLESADDYASPEPLSNRRTVEWLHGMGDVVTALAEAGLVLRWLREHDAIPWQMFERLERGPDRLYRWPDKPWLPLGFSLWAEKA